MSSNLNIECRLNIFRCFVQSHFNYCPIVWHFCGQQNTRKLEKIQERGLRFVYNDYNSTYEELLNKADLPILELSRLRIIAVDVYKTVNGYSPNYICNLFQQRKTNYDFKDPFRLDVPRYNTTNCGKHSFKYFGSQLWNNLTVNLKSTPDINTFKKLIKTWTGPLCKYHYCKH